MERFLITSAFGLVLIGIIGVFKYLIIKNESLSKDKGNDLTDRQIRSHAKATWLIMPVSLVFSFLSSNPSSSNGGGAGLLIIGFFVFLISSIVLALRAWRVKNLFSGKPHLRYSNPL